MPQHRLVILGVSRGPGLFAPGLENPDVNAARVRIAPAQVPRRHDQGSVIPQNLAHLVQFAAQVG